MSIGGVIGRPMEDREREGGKEREKEKEYLALLNHIWRDNEEREYFTSLDQRYRED